ncbi:MAG TPA: hypothetical protein VEI97_14915, partial [bacterium]|nr:hypothetical protein [bacterium]
ANGIAHSALGLYRLEIDPATLQAAATPLTLRAGQKNSDLYLLPIDNFLQPDSFTVDAVALTDTAVQLSYTVRHPFPAPADPAGVANGSTNRADLGIAARVLFLVDVPSATGNTYFDETSTGGDRIILDDDTIANADGYLEPAGMLSPGTTANTFPYRLVIDELGTGNRVGVTNGGTPTGNFGSDGWTRSELGASRTGWTGYGVLHQGQAATNTVALSLDALGAGGPFSLDIAIIAKYNDPRGGTTGAEKKANRLPPPAPDHTKFAYRMPHGAIDVERIRFEYADGYFITNQISAVTLVFHVRDWDARSTATALSDLSQDPDVTKVSPGEPGVPLLALSIPGVLGGPSAIDTWDASTVQDDDSGYGGDVDQDSGRPGDELFYSKAVTKLVTSGQTDGYYTAVVRGTDPEASLSQRLFTPLTADLVPVSANAPEPVAYQVFEVLLHAVNGAPTATVANPTSPVASGNGQLTLRVTSYNDPNPTDTIQIQFDWNDDGDFADAGEAYQPITGPTPVLFNAPITYSNATLVPQNRSVPYRYTDALSPPITGTAQFTLGANQPPSVTGSVSLQQASVVSPATFTVIANPGFSASDPEDDPVTFTVRGTPNSGSAQTTSGITAFPAGSGSAFGPYTNPPVTSVTFAVFANDPLHPSTAGSVAPTSPSPLVGTPAACGPGSLPSVGNITLQTLKPGLTPRTGTAADQTIAGVRISWGDIAGEGAYAVYRAPWPAGTAVAGAAFSLLTATAANATSFDDTTVMPNGRYLYRVNPRCSAGGADGPASQYAVALLQDWEAAGSGSQLTGSLLNGFIGTAESTSVSNLAFGAFALNGAGGLRSTQFNSILPSNAWMALTTMGLEDR